jgi:hypothetical protein
MSDPVDRLHRRATLLVIVLWVLLVANGAGLALVWHYAGLARSDAAAIHATWDAVHARCVPWQAAVWPQPWRPEGFSR